MTIIRVFVHLCNSFRLPSILNLQSSEPIKYLLHIDGVFVTLCVVCGKYPISTKTMLDHEKKTDNQPHPSSASHQRLLHSLQKHIFNKWYLCDVTAANKRTKHSRINRRFHASARRSGSGADNNIALQNSSFSSLFRIDALVGWIECISTSLLQHGIARIISLLHMSSTLLRVHQHWTGVHVVHRIKLIDDNARI